MFYHTSLQLQKLQPGFKSSYELSGCIIWNEAWQLWAWKQNTFYCLKAFLHHLTFIPPPNTPYLSHRHSYAHTANILQRFYPHQIGEEGPQEEVFFS